MAKYIWAAAAIIAAMYHFFYGPLTKFEATLMMVFLLLYTLERIRDELKEANRLSKLLLRRSCE